MSDRPDCWMWLCSALGGDVAQLLFEIVEIFAEAFGGDEAGRVVAGVIDAFAGREAFERGLGAVGIALEVLQQLWSTPWMPVEMLVMTAAEDVAGGVYMYGRPLWGVGNRGTGEAVDVGGGGS